MTWLLRVWEKKKTKKKTEAGSCGCIASHVVLAGLCIR